MKGLCLLVLLCNFAYGSTREPNWVLQARKLSGASDQVRNASIHALEQTPKIETILREALTGPKRYLALDVISTLKLKQLAPDLIRLSEKDATGTYYLALNTLITSFNEPQYKELYAKRLLEGASPAAGRMILLDTLLRMGFRLSPSQLSEFLRKDQSPEVKSSALLYLRSAILARHYDDFLPLLHELIEDKKVSKQLKLQALFLASELPPEAFQHVRDIRAPCPKPPPPALREICAQFLDGNLAQ